MYKKISALIKSADDAEFESFPSVNKLDMG